uniref:uncharacterized protein LOC120329088 n=1 Tax=Styela clava TaxID=7725 RepID=UPI00193A325E|nr:uncharacterized protein LOC120329088 [Styela clava]
MSDRSRRFTGPRLPNDAQLCRQLQRFRINSPETLRFPGSGNTTNVPLPPTHVYRGPRSTRARFFEAPSNSSLNRFGNSARWRNFGMRMAASVHSLPQTQQLYQNRHRFHSDRNLSSSSSQVHRLGYAEFATTSGYCGYGNPPMWCAFCKSNKEPRHVYSSHWLKDANGKIACPILRRYRCKHCGATGDKAHTDSYCPTIAQDKRSMKSVLTTLKTSSGKYRK